MRAHLSATFEVKSWDEKEFDDLAELPKLTQAVVTKSYSGDVEGSSTTQWLMAYAADGSATFIGLERITGQFDGDSGSLVLQHVGTYSDGSAKAHLVVIEGSGSGALESVSGTGDFLADPGGSLELDLSST
jgi:hypothetical protein